MSKDGKLVALNEDSAEGAVAYLHNTLEENPDTSGVLIAIFTGDGQKARFANFGATMGELAYASCFFSFAATHQVDDEDG